jgi:hypothetical protein
VVLACVTLAAAAPSFPDFKITLPIDKNGGTSGKAMEVRDLSNFEMAPWYREVTVAGESGMAFRANCGGARTSSRTKFSRSELREQSNGKGASWSFTDGATHRMTVREAIVALPPRRPHVTAAQIHDAKNDVFMLKAEGKGNGMAALYACLDNDNVKVLVDGNYVLGTPYTLEVSVTNKVLTVSYQGAVVEGLSAFTDFSKIKKQNSRFTGMYFKAGCYIQSNVKNYGEKADSFAEVVVFDLKVEH